MFSYSTSFMPGVHFYTFLAAKEAAPSRTARRHSNLCNGAAGPSDNDANPRLSARKQNLALKLNVPDTILYGETGRAVWIYTDKEGYVQRLTEFSDKQVLDKFAEGTPAISDEQHLVVYKEPVATMAPATQQNGPAAFNYQGNQLRLLNLGEVKALLNGVMAMHKSFALQQFVKCNGSKAFVQRAVYEAGKPPHAWMISNIEPFRDPNAPASPTPVINAIYDIPPELYKAEQENARIEAAANEVAETEGRKRSQRASASRLYLRINALGYTECIPINPDDILEANEKAPDGARRRRDSAANSVTEDDDTESRDGSDEPQSSRRQSSWQQLSHPQTSRHHQVTSSNNNNEVDVNYWLPTNLIRTIPFFAPRTPLQSKLKETSGITPFLTEDNSVRVQLIRSTEPPLQDPVALAARRKPRNRRAALVPATAMSDLVMQMHSPTHSVVLGSTKIRMTQFRSSYVTKIDYYACMAITGEMLNIKGNIGLERVRYVDSKLLTSQHRLRFYNGVFVPDESYTTGDALSSEWMDCFRASSYIVTRPPKTISTNIEPAESPNKRAQRKSTTNNQGNTMSRRATRPTSSRASLMDEDEEMDKELEQMIERANMRQQEAHFRQMGRIPAHPPSNNSEEKAASATAIKQELLRNSAGTPSKSATQMAMLMNKPVISPRSELVDCTGPEDNNHNAASANGTPLILPSPRNRKWMWSLVLLINQAHNLQSRERSCCRWECHYTLLTQRRSALERLPVTSRTRSETLSASASTDVLSSQSTSKSSHLEVQFNCTHKFCLAGTTLMVQAYLRNNPALRLYFRNDMYASTRSESEGEFYGVVGLSKLLQKRGFDTTIDIIAAHDDPSITPREAAAISRMSPYLSLSVQLSRMSIDPDEALADSKFVELGCTVEGLQVLRKVS
ncbi:hypothetical protein PRIC2_012956 [Phytophthora ramorum]